MGKSSFKQTLQRREARALLVEQFRAMLETDEVSNLHVLYECARQLCAKDFKKIFGKKNLEETYVSIMKEVLGDSIGDTARFIFGVASPKGLFRRLFNLD